MVSTVAQRYLSAKEAGQAGENYIVHRCFDDDSVLEEDLTCIEVLLDSVIHDTFKQISISGIRKLREMRILFCPDALA